MKLNSPDILRTDYLELRRKPKGLRPSQIAKQYGIPRHVAYWWFTINNFLPGVIRDPDTGALSVPVRHAVIDPEARPIWLPGMWTRPPTGRPRGRPPGPAKKPYPTGVKRPRKPKE